MLGRQHLITTFRHGKAYPFKLALTPENLQPAKNLIRLFQSTVGQRRIEIEDEVRRISLESRTPKVIAGLAEILFKQSEFAQIGREDPAIIRSRVFSAAARYWKDPNTRPLHYLKHRQSIFQSLTIEGPKNTDEIDAWLFGDILSHQKLQAFTATDPETLLHRYNLCQLQGVIADSTRVELKVYRYRNSAFRQVMQMLKFFRLLFAVTKSSEEWLTLTIDGPASILENSRSYGVEIANFVPAVLLLNAPWFLTATVKIPQRPRLFTLELSNDNPYHSGYREKRVWINEKVEGLVRRFNHKYHDHFRAEVTQHIVPLRHNRYLIPDVMIRSEGGQSGDSTEPVFMLEWVHYPSTTKLQALERISAEIPDNYLIAIRGKRSKLTSLIDRLEPQLIVFSAELTAPALFKKLDSRLSTLSRQPTLQFGQAEPGPDL
jgi:uncharacterized protein